MNSSANKGFTLIELLIAMVIASIVLAVVVSAYQLQVRGKNTQEALTDMNQTTRAALEIMTSEIRTAGLDPLQTAGAGILIAQDGQLSFTMDIGNTAGNTLQPDGTVAPGSDGPNERVRYALYTDSDGNQNLGRATGTAVNGTGGTMQPLARNVDALNFVYLDGNDPPNVISTPVSAANLATIRRIEVTIVARAGEKAAGFMNPYTNKTAYVNLRGTTVLPAQNDSFRRLALTATINCLNISN
jgi:type IV pilus assembly protein PilW